MQVVGSRVKSYDLSTEINRYSDLSDKARAGTIEATERKQLRSMRKRLAI